MIVMEKKMLKIASKIENLTLVEKLINDICSELKVNEDHYGNILVALTEAVNNAIQHGNKGNPEKTIDIKLISSGEESLSFTIEDQGEGFDYHNLPDPTAPENIESPNGRGVFLMKNLSDKVEFFNE